jgi:ribosomal protein S18 acetylase RimI-like enzyme
MSRTYPDAPAGPYEPPPLTVTDREDRGIELRVFADDDTEFEAAVAMYEGFDAADRAQGIPPSDEHRIREWLDTITGDDCHNVFAWDGDTVAGHATLVPDDDAHELAIFVDQAYQGAGVGTALIEALLGHGARVGIERVWLTVERWNRAAVALYEKVGFETASAESFELEMAARLADPDADQNGGGEGDTVGGANTAGDPDTPEESNTAGDPDAVESDGDTEPVASNDGSDEPDGNDTDGDFVTTTRGDPDSNANLDTETGSDTE